MPRSLVQLAPNGRFGTVCTLVHAPRPPEGIGRLKHIQKITPRYPGTAPRRFLCSWLMELVPLATHVSWESSVPPRTSVLVDDGATQARAKVLCHTEEP